MKYMMLIVILLLTVAANAYAAHRIWYLIPPSLPVARWVAVASIAALFAFIFVVIIGQRWLPEGVLAFMYRSGTSWFFILLYLTMIFLVLDFVRLAGLLPADKFLFGNWFTLGGIALVLGVVFGLGYLNYTRKERVEITIPIPEGTRLTHPVKIVAISDLHLGYGIGRRELAGWVDLINAEEPDIVLIAGDVIDNSVAPLERQRMEEEFHRIRSKYGVFASPGNHEYISGIGRSTAFMQRAGITFLRDSTALVDSLLYIVGRDDLTHPNRAALGDLTAPLDRSLPVIVLDHQPQALDRAAEAGVTLQISGHTHRGQVWPVSWIADAMFEPSYGLRRHGDTYVYVTSGLGIWGGKFRIGTQSEYVVIRLLAGTDGASSL